MKKIIFLFAFGFLFLNSGFSQQAIKVGPLGFIFGNYNLRYEKALNEKSSFLVGANYYDYELFDAKSTGFGLDAGWRHYFKESIRGAYVYPYASFAFNSTDVSITDDTKAKFSTLGISTVLGYQWVAGGGFVVDFGLGYGYKIQVSKDDSLINDYSGGGVRFLFSVGYAF